MSDDFPASVDVEYTDGEGEQPEDYPSIHDKIEKAVEVTRRGLEEYDTPAVMWTGGEVPRGRPEASCFHDALYRFHEGIRRECSLRRRGFGHSPTYLVATAERLTRLVFAD